MKYTRAGIFTVLALALVLALMAIGCSKSDVAEGPKQEFVTKNLMPSKIETKSDNLNMTVEDLKVNWTENAGNKEIVETPSLRGKYKVINTSKDLLEIQGVTVEYVDRSGQPIAFKSGERTAKVSLVVTSLKPQESSEGTLDVTFPRAALKALDKIKINIVYIPSPLKRETLTLPGKVES
ncbi:MAG: hypothetical protein A4E57_01220 [Syntrophorhabdaceae bacterium PtaU1.Bin034]|nr:MAG: hypothetical protein A4E57_01220 [Syntrophorhabdaceae bacterium PtaU1.Bin034]